MKTPDNRLLCDLCFSEKFSKAMKCPHCSEIKNSEIYPSALPEGKILAGKFAVGKVLGNGGFGITYLCYDLQNNKRIAIKEFMPVTLSYRLSGTTKVLTNKGENAEQFKNCVRKFYNEAELVAELRSNPGIISVYEFFYENNTAYFTMEYLEGYDLKEYVKKNGGKIPESEAVYILKNMLDALITVHGTGVLHRDIKPDNIYICNDGTVKLIDFGAARQVLGEASKSLSVILTPGFAPLEQYQKKGHQGAWTDIYALGATMYYALTGKILDDAMTRIDDPEIDMVGISSEMAAILEKMLAVRIEGRYHNVIDIKTELERTSIPSSVPVLNRITVSPPSKHLEPPKRLGNPNPMEYPIKPILEPPKPPKPWYKRQSSFKIAAVIFAFAVAVAGTAIAVILGVNNPDIPYSKTNKYAVTHKNTNIRKPAMDKTNALLSSETLAVSSVSKDNILDSGKCGENVTWTLNKTGFFVLSGSGNMSDYTNSSSIPWDSYRNEIKYVIINNGVTGISNYAFAYCSDLKSVKIGTGVTSIGKNAFYKCTGLTRIIIPEKVKTIEKWAFYGCSDLQSISVKGHTSKPSGWDKDWISNCSAEIKYTAKKR